MVHCNIEFEVMAVKYFPIESLDDFEDELPQPIKFCPFCGDKITEEE